MSTDINVVVLERALSALPHLLSLRIQSCMKIEHSAVFRLTSFVSELEELAVTIWVNIDRFALILFAHNFLLGCIADGSDKRCLPQSSSQTNT